ncbi:MAG TPA: hypothetical protein VMM92_08840 [Thermoanaerobaculia bacterium]|nr:hypothetical protein [Thermoanaerobaculia bacterium]
MKMRTLIPLGCLLALSLAASASAQVQPGVGFDAQKLGQIISRYWVQDLTTGGLSERDYRIDFTETNPLASSAAFERRWGPGSYTRKKWLGPDNELVLTVEQAFNWAFQNQPALLGVANPAGWSGHPNQVELLDSCATGYATTVVVAYAQATWDGASPDRRLTINDPSKPRGDFSERNPYWPLTMYYHNTFRGNMPISPQVPWPADSGQ